MSGDAAAARDGSTLDPPAQAAAKLSRHRRWDTRDGLPHNTVTAIARDATGYLWLGTVEGLVRFDGEIFTVYDTSTTPELRNDFINALLVAEDGSLWIGTRRGLNRYLRGSFSLYTQAQGLAGDIIEDLAVDAQGDLWIGTRSGLSRFSGGRFQNFGPEDGLVATSVFSLAVDLQGDLWVGAMEGLSRYSDGGFAQLGVEEGLSDNFVVSLEPGSGPELWAGTVDGGLHRVDTDRFSATRASSRGEPRLVFSLHHTDEGTLWIGSRTGLERATDGALEEIPAVGRDLVMALFEDPREKLWVGTLQTGLHCLDAGSDPHSTEPAVVVLESLHLNQRSHGPDETVIFPKGRADVEFRYTAIDYDHPQSLRFRYLLEGYDDHWVDAGRERHAEYTNLPPGSYRFTVKSTRTLDRGSQDSYEFEVPARFHQTRIFGFLVLAAVASILWGLFVLRVRRLLRTRLMLQRRVEEQTQEILAQRDQLESFHRRLDEAHHQLQQTNRELKSRNREKSDFLAIATHDLRAPLVNLKGFAVELHHSLDQVKTVLEPILSELPGGVSGRSPQGPARRRTRGPELHRGIGAEDGKGDRPDPQDVTAGPSALENPARQPGGLPGPGGDQAPG